MAELEIVEKKHGGRRAGSGMKPGQKIRKTIERDAALKAYQQLVLENLKPLFRKQLWLAMGQTYVYRIDKHRTKGEATRIEHVLLDDPREIADALDILANGDSNGGDDGNGFYYIMTKPPENGAIRDMLDRSIGKPAQKISGDKDNPLEVVNIITYAKGIKPSA